jgi:radical SAM protein
MSFSSKPVLVFWETTRACLLSCLHCRASAITDSLPKELSTEEGYKLIDAVRSFGKPYPTIIFTGGDPPMRKDLFELLGYALRSGVSFAVSPAATPLLTKNTLARLKEARLASLSVSLDGSSPEVHDAIRGQPGTFERTIEAISNALQIGIKVQVNTAIMKRNFRDLPDILHLIRGLGISTWELFFLVKVGRGESLEDLSPEENEGVCNFLYEASHYDLIVRCVEAPFIRRVVKQRKEAGRYWDQHANYQTLHSRLVELEGFPRPKSVSTIATKGTLDGDGIIFVGYDGTISPGGLIPINLGNVREDDIVYLYQNNKILTNIRERRFNGRCGVCEFKEICGGSRARAFSLSGDPLSSDPACVLTETAAS